MIKDLIQIYISISNEEEILELIVNDERSYTDDMLVDLGKTSYQKNLFPGDVFIKLEELNNKLIAISLRTKALKDILDDIPDKYCCAITYDMLEDPVMLPGQEKLIVDRANIKQHITLSGEYNPFNRAVLKMKDLIEMPQLKVEIKKWVDEKLAQKQSERKVNMNFQNQMIDEDSLFNTVDLQETVGPTAFSKNLFGKK